MSKKSDGGGLRRSLHAFTTMFWFMKTMILKRQRSDEEKLRRHRYGDKGAKFSGGKIPCIGGDIIGTVTTMVTKDILLLEIYE